jgi:hypothetical protein
MAVHVHCTQCAADLEVDEGFRGGVCRCSSCGTLLAVPPEGGGEGEGAPPPRRRQRPANPNDDPSLLRQNQEDLKQRTGSFPALTELIGSSSGLQGGRHIPAQPAGNPSESALGLSPPSGADFERFDAPASSGLEAPGAAEEEGPAPSPAEATPPSAAAPPAATASQIFPAQPVPGARHVSMAVVAAGVLVVLFVIVAGWYYLSSGNRGGQKAPPAPMPGPVAPTVVPETAASEPLPVREAGPATTPVAATGGETAPASEPATAPATEPATAPATEPVTSPATELAPAP